MFSFKRRPCFTPICAGTIWLKYLFSKTPSEHSFLACRFEYICPLKHHCNIPKPNISELICDAGISPAGTFYCCEYFTLFLVLIYLAYRLRSCLGVTKQTRVLSCPSPPCEGLRATMWRCTVLVLRQLVIACSFPIFYICMKSLK